VTAIELQLEMMAEQLEQSPDYRVLRRFHPRDRYASYPDIIDQVIDDVGPPLKTGLFLDVETTGLDTESDRIIELAMVPFEFDENGNVYDVREGVSWFDDPERPISAEVTALTGITNEMVKGKRIDGARVVAELANASVVIAHNADFDRRMAERRHADFARISWGCSYREVEWERFGCTSKKLEHILAATCHEFFDAHRALDDCYVGIHCLATAQLDGRTAFSHLLDSVRAVTNRVWALGAPFSVKDALKARGYRWSEGSGGKPKAWFKDISATDVLGEEAWLRSVAGVFSPSFDKHTARERYSVRCDR
jgi:DNA polymerase-3 subunit epsilon